METENKNKLIEIITKESVDKKHYFQLPYYAKNSVYAFKVLSKDYTVVVEYASTERGIQTRPTGYTNAFNESALPITEPEFYTLYNQVTHELYNISIGKEVKNDNS